MIRVSIASGVAPKISAAMLIAADVDAARPQAGLDLNVVPRDELGESSEDRRPLLEIDVTGHDGVRGLAGPGSKLVPADHVAGVGRGHDAARLQSHRSDGRINAKRWNPQACR